MIQMSTSSLVVISGDHGVLSIYLSLVTPSLGRHRPHCVSSVITGQELVGVRSQSSGTELPRDAMPQYVHLS